MTLLMAACRECRPSLNLHDRGCNTNSSMVAPQLHLCERHMRRPSQRERDIRIVSPSSKVQTAADGTALSHAPDRDMLAALKHARRY